MLKEHRKIMDLAESLNLSDSAVGEHLKALRKVNFVEFDSVSSESSG